MRKLVVPVLALAGALAGMGAAMGSPADTFSRSPAAGPPGSTITVASVTPCPESPGQKTGPGKPSESRFLESWLCNSDKVFAVFRP